MSLSLSLKKLTRQRRSQSLQTKTCPVMESVTTLELEERYRTSVTWESRVDLEDTSAGQDLERSSSGTLGKTGTS